MNLGPMAIAILAAGSSAFAHNNAVEALGKITVCVAHGMSDPALGNAELMASSMFAAAGVAVAWHDTIRPCRDKESAIVIDLAQMAPRDASPTALAAANVGDDVHITVFLERVATTNPAIHTQVLAHVLVHEITHIVQGVARHSETGVMKARWTSVDYSEMRLRPLRFAPEDIELIRQGMAMRAARRLQSSAAEAGLNQLVR